MTTSVSHLQLYIINAELSWRKSFKLSSTHALHGKPQLSKKKWSYTNSRSALFASAKWNKLSFVISLSLSLFSSASLFLSCLLGRDYFFLSFCNCLFLLTSVLWKDLENPARSTTCLSRNKATITNHHSGEFHYDELRVDLSEMFWSSERQVK